jgi:hypothetical protein
MGPSHKAGEKAAKGRKHGRSNILTDTPEKLEIECKRPRKGGVEYSKKILAKKCEENEHC